MALDLTHLEIGGQYRAYYDNQHTRESKPTNTVHPYATIYVVHRGLKNYKVVTQDIKGLMDYRNETHETLELMLNNGQLIYQNGGHFTGVLIDDEQ